jgi:hypothetical protein
MATRPHIKNQNALVQAFVVPATKAVTLGKRVKFSGADNAVEDCGANEDGIGIAMESGVAGDTVSISLEGFAVVEVLVGTGGATRGAYAKFLADGFTDQATADGTTVRFLVGKFMQSGVAGDRVGLLLGATSPHSTS